MALAPTETQLIEEIPDPVESDRPETLEEFFADREPRVMGDQALVKQIPMPEKFSAHIYAPDSSSDWNKPSIGYVVAIGPGTYMEDGRIRPVHSLYPVQPDDKPKGDGLKVGDLVQFGNVAGYSAAKTRYEGSDLLLLRESDIHIIWDRKG